MIVAAAAPRAVLLAFGLLAGACSWQEPVAGPASDVVARPDHREPHAATVPPTERIRATAVSTAVSQVGRPYLYGGEDPAEGFDCSGLVWFAYRSAGVATPRTTHQLWRELAPVEPALARPGDLLFFDIDGKPQHVGLYIGDGRFVHAPSSGKTVTIAKLSSPYYRRVLLRGARVVD